MQLFIVLFTEIINICNICTLNTIMDIIMNFIALGVIAEIDNYYSSSLGNSKIKALID
jgi:hypothetical protein